MADMISSVDALFSYYGATLFVLGLIFCFSRRTFKFGVLTMLLADIPLALAIAFPRKVIEQLNSWGIQSSDLPDPQTGHTYGIIAGIVTFVVLFALRYLVNAMFFKRKAVSQNNEPNDDAPIDIAEDDPATTQESIESKNEGGLFKGLAIKGKKSHQSASALHLSSDDNPLNFADTQAEFSALKKNESHDELVNNLGSDPSFAQDPHDGFSLSQVHDNDHDDLKEPTLSSDVFKNHMSHNEPNFSNSFIENAAIGSLKHNYQSEPKALQSNQTSVGIASLGVQNPLTGQTENKDQDNKSSWSSLLSKITQASQDQAKNSSADPTSANSLSSLGNESTFNAYGPKSKEIAKNAARRGNVPYIGSQVQDDTILDLNNLSLAGNKVGDLLDVMDEPNISDKLKERSNLNKSNSSFKDNGDFNFADMLNSASKKQSLLEQGLDKDNNQQAFDSYDQAASHPSKIDSFDGDNLSQAQINEEQLSYAALGKGHKTVSQALADLDDLEKDTANNNNDQLTNNSVKPNNISPDKLNEENQGDREKPNSALEVMAPTKISYLYSDPVHEDISAQDNEDEEPDNILDKYQGDSTNYSFSIKGVFKEKPKLSVSGFVDRSSYLGQSQYEADFHEKELENIVSVQKDSDNKEQSFNDLGSDHNLQTTKLLEKEADHKSAQDTTLSSSHAQTSAALKNKREQVLAMARQVAAQISAELEASIASKYSNHEQALQLLDEDNKSSLEDAPKAHTNKAALHQDVAKNFALDNNHLDDYQDEAHALASLFAKKAHSNDELEVRKFSHTSDIEQDSKLPQDSQQLLKNKHEDKFIDSDVLEFANDKTSERKLDNKIMSDFNNAALSESKSKQHVRSGVNNLPANEINTLSEPNNKIREQKVQDNKDIREENISSSREKSGFNKGASLESLKLKAKQDAQNKAKLIAKEKAQAALDVKEQLDSEINKANKAQTEAEARAYKASKEQNPNKEKVKPFTVQQVSAPIESKSTLNRVSKNKRNVNSSNVSENRGLSFIKALKSKSAAAKAQRASEQNKLNSQETSAILSKSPKLDNTNNNNLGVAKKIEVQDKSQTTKDNNIALAKAQQIVKSKAAPLVNSALNAASLEQVIAPKALLAQNDAQKIAKSQDLAKSKASSIVTSGAKALTPAQRAAPNKTTATAQKLTNSQDLAKSKASSMVTSGAKVMAQAQGVAPNKTTAVAQKLTNSQDLAKSKASSMVTSGAKVMAQAQGAVPKKTTAVAQKLNNSQEPAKKEAVSLVSKGNNTQANSTDKNNITAKLPVKSVAQAQAQTKGNFKESAVTNSVSNSNGSLPSKANLKSVTEPAIKDNNTNKDQNLSQKPIVSIKDNVSKSNNESSAKNGNIEDMSATSNVKASLKNKKRTHKKVEENVEVELLAKDLIKDAALASLSSLEDEPIKVISQDDHKLSDINKDKEDKTLRKSASLKRTFGLKRNK